VAGAISLREALRNRLSGFTRGAILADLIGRGRTLVWFARSASFGATPQDNFDRAVARNLDPSYVCAGSEGCSMIARGVDPIFWATTIR
jgi:hypothetical protein